jgi:hypothetical protein
LTSTTLPLKGQTGQFLSETTNVFLTTDEH